MTKNHHIIVKNGPKCHNLYFFNFITILTTIWLVMGENMEKIFLGGKNPKFYVLFFKKNIGMGVKNVKNYQKMPKIQIWTNLIAERSYFKYMAKILTHSH